MERTVEDLEQEIKTEHDLYLRALADFDNFRRRVDRERAEFGKYALRKFVLSLLDVIDDLERFLHSAGPDQSPFVEGMRLVHKKLLELLEREGVRPFESVGLPFDPFLHEAIATAPARDGTEGIVLQELRRGYRWGDEPLRSARVVVSM